MDDLDPNTNPDFGIAPIPEAEAKPDVPRKVAIVGTAQTSRMEAPFSDPTWEIWTVGDGFQFCPRIDRYFEVHPEQEIDQIVGLRQWLAQEQATPKVTMFDFPWVSNGSTYPSEVILKTFGRYFTNTVSWMLALAIHEGVDQLAIYGVDMAAGTEYAAQRPSCEFLIGVAIGRGIPVTIPNNSDLLKTPFQYGLESAPFNNFANRMVELQAQLAQQTHKKTEAMLNEAKLSGAIEILAYVQTAWVRPDPPTMAGVNNPQFNPQQGENSNGA